MRSLERLEDETYFDRDDDDGVLVRRAQKDLKQFGALYEKYVKQVYSYVFYRVGNTADAEDITESAFYHALLNFDSYEHRGIPFSAWLLRIAHNLIANWYRDKARRRFVDIEQIGEIESEDLSPEQIFDDMERWNVVREAIGTLPEDRQAALLLRYAGGLKHGEIAKIMNKTTGAVKVLVHRALGSVTKYVEEKERRSRDEEESSE